MNYHTEEGTKTSISSRDTLRIALKSVLVSEICSLYCHLRGNTYIITSNNISGRCRHVNNDSGLQSIDGRNYLLIVAPTWWQYIELLQLLIRAGMKYGAIDSQLFLCAVAEVCVDVRALRERFVPKIVCPTVWKKVNH